MPNSSAAGYTEVWIDAACNGTPPCYVTIQEGIDAVDAGGTVHISGGSFAEVLNLGGKSLKLEGAGAGSTIVNASSLTGYAVKNFGNDTTISGLTLVGTPDNYGFKVSHVSNIKLKDIKVENSKKTGIDLNTIDGATLSNVGVKNTVSGFGLMMLDSNDITVTDISTENNAWGGVSIQSSGRESGNITFSGVFSAAESSPLLIEKDPPTYPAITNVQVPDKFDYITYGFREGHEYMQWFYRETVDGAKEVAQGLMGSVFNYSDMLIYDVLEENYHVIEGMLIQDAIDAASDGDKIKVDAGLYEELITIGKSITLRGATYDVNKNGYPVPGNYTWDDSVETILQPPGGSEDSDVITVDDADDVSIEGLVVQALERSAAGSRMLITVKVDDKTMENLNIRNNVIGANTDADGQDGTKGRMNLYLDVNPYNESQGLINSLISGNKIFGAEGNGNNVFIWASYHSYGTEGPSPMEGTVIEDNEIYGSHRTGIETAGGYSGLVIRNNKIYGNRGLSGEETNLKYGHGIIIIRGSSDRTFEGFSAEDLTIEGNEIYGNEKSAIYFGPVNHNYDITGNHIHDNGWDGIMLDLDGNFCNPTFETCPPPSTSKCYNCTEDILVRKNTIRGNGEYGVRIVSSNDTSVTIEAVSNYWGSSLPDFSSIIKGEISYAPWFTGESMDKTADDFYSEEIANTSEATIENDTIGIDIELKLDSNKSGSVSIVSHVSAPEIVVSTVTSHEASSVTSLGKVIEIIADEEIEDAMNETVLKVYYTDSEVSAKNVNEASLRLYFYNDTLDEWVIYDDLVGGVDTVQNYVWAITDHFSIWDVFGSVNQRPTDDPDPGYGSQTIVEEVCEPDWTCADWEECLEDGKQSCTSWFDTNSCGLEYEGSGETQSCEYAAPEVEEEPEPEERAPTVAREGAETESVSGAVAATTGNLIDAESAGVLIGTTAIVVIVLSAFVALIVKKN